MNGQPHPDHSSDDLLIDSLLGEVLGGETPPDLRDRIMAAARQGQLPAAMETEHDVDGLGIQVRANFHQDFGASSVTRMARRRRTVRSETPWSLFFVALSLLALFTAIGYLASLDKKQPQVVDAPNSPAPVAPADSLVEAESSTPEVREEAPIEVVPAPVKELERPSLQDALAARNEPPEVSFGSSEFQNSAASSDAEVVAFVNASLQQSWTSEQIEAAPLASDEVWCDRVFQTVLGRQPSPEERNAFVRTKDANKDAKLIRWLVNSERTSADVQQRWSGILASRLVRPLRDRSADLAAVQASVQGWLENNPLDQTVRLMLTSDQPEFVKLYDLPTSKSAVDLASQFCRTILGQRTDCAGCHADSQRQWQPHQVHSLAWYFEGSVDPSDAVAVERRRHFADELVQRDDMSRVVVDQVWRSFFGYGFSAIPGDLQNRSAVSHVAVLDRLAQEFVASDYDLRKLTSWIASSRSFRLEAGTLQTSDVMADGSVAFNRFYQPNRISDTLANSLQLVASASKNIVATEASSGEVVARRDDNLLEPNEFGRQITNGEIARTVSLMNSDADRRRLIVKLDLVRSLASSSLSKEDLINHLFMEFTGQLPSDIEQKFATRILDAHPDDVELGLRDIAWSLFNAQL
ncbi:MAG: DUF1553 domain-containing protein [Planctomycetales bacterium]|nr:DUF1553 domain-containing protein [Planctomycetales bacterium]